MLSSLFSECAEAVAVGLWEKDPSSCRRNCTALLLYVEPLVVPFFSSQRVSSAVHDYHSLSACANAAEEDCFRIYLLLRPNTVDLLNAVCIVRVRNPYYIWRVQN